MVVGWSMFWGLWWGSASWWDHEAEEATHLRVLGSKEKEEPVRGSYTPRRHSTNDLTSFHLAPPLKSPTNSQQCNVPGTTPSVRGLLGTFRIQSTAICYPFYSLHSLSPRLCLLLFRTGDDMLSHLVQTVACLDRKRNELPTYVMLLKICCEESWGIVGLTLFLFILKTAY